MKNFFYHLHIFFSRVAKFLSVEKHLHTAKFASPHELKSILSDKLDGTNLLLGKSHFNRVLRISTETRKELGNLLVVAPTRGGKGLLGTSQLLTWQGSAIVNDIKGELFNETAGYRSTLGKVFVIDPTGIGHRYDPLLGKKIFIYSPQRQIFCIKIMRAKELYSRKEQPLCLLSYFLRREWRTKTF